MTEASNEALRRYGAAVAESGAWGFLANYGKDELLFTLNAA